MTSATCTIDWDGRTVAACNGCAGITPDVPRRPVQSAAMKADRKLSSVHRIVAYVHSHGSEGLSAAGIAEALSLSVNSVSSVLCRMADEGFVSWSGHRAGRMYRPGVRKPDAGRWYAARRAA